MKSDIIWENLQNKKSTSRLREVLDKKFNFKIEKLPEGSNKLSMIMLSYMISSLLIYNFINA